MSDEVNRTEVFTALGYLLAAWRDDPDRLAVAVTAYEKAGWHMAAYEVGSTCGAAGKPYIKEADAQALINAALYRRNKRLLRHRADGLLMAVEAFAGSFEAMRLHDVRVESAVIECRELPLEERLEKLREMEAARG
jgi:hypothetical protein